MTRRTKVKDISRNPGKQLLDVKAEDLMPLPCSQDKPDTNPPFSPLTEEQKNMYECSLDGISAILLPKPQSKETAILMLADGCEARVRSARPASTDEIDQIIRDTIQSRLDQGQLDESDLTLRDLEQIRAAFLSVLKGVFHPRVQYPEPVKVAAADGREVVR